MPITVKRKFGARTTHSGCALASPSDPMSIWSGW
jgi:hypothetical protein